MPLGDVSNSPRASPRARKTTSSSSSSSSSVRVLGATTSAADRFIGGAKQPRAAGKPRGSRPGRGGKAANGFAQAGESGNFVVKQTKLGQRLVATKSANANKWITGGGGGKAEQQPAQQQPPLQPPQQSPLQQQPPQQQQRTTSLTSRELENLDYSNASASALLQPESSTPRKLVTADDGRTISAIDPAPTVSDESTVAPSVVLEVHGNSFSVFDHSGRESVGSSAYYSAAETSDGSAMVSAMMSASRASSFASPASSGAGLELEAGIPPETTSPAHAASSASSAETDDSTWDGGCGERDCLSSDCPVLEEGLPDDSPVLAPPPAPPLQLIPTVSNSPVQTHNINRSCDPSGLLSFRQTPGILLVCPGHGGSASAAPFRVLGGSRRWITREAADQQDASPRILPGSGKAPHLRPCTATPAV